MPSTAWGIRSCLNVYSSALHYWGAFFLDLDPSSCNSCMFRTTCGCKQFPSCHESSSPSCRQVNNPSSSIGGQMTQPHAVLTIGLPLATSSMPSSIPSAWLPSLAAIIGPRLSAGRGIVPSGSCTGTRSSYASSTRGRLAQRRQSYPTSPTLLAPSHLRS